LEKKKTPTRRKKTVHKAQTGKKKGFKQRMESMARLRGRIKRGEREGHWKKLRRPLKTKAQAKPRVGRKSESELGRAEKGVWAKCQGRKSRRSKT